MGKKKKRKTSKSKIRILISFIVFGSVIAALFYDCLNIIEIIFSFFIFSFV